MSTFKIAIFYFIQGLYFLIIARAILSWFIRDLRNPVVRFIYDITEPLLSPFRTLLQKLGLGGTMIDFSPILLFIFLNMLSRFILGL